MNMNIKNENNTKNEIKEWQTGATEHSIKLQQQIETISKKIQEIELNIEYLLQILECYAQAFQNLCEKIKTYNF